MNVLFEHIEVVDFARVGHNFIVGFNNVFGNVLNLSQQFRYGLFVLRAKVNIHAREDSLD